MTGRAYGQGAEGMIGRLGLLAVAVVLLGVGGACTVACVPTGHVGVVTTFGRVTGRQLAEGASIVAPWQGVQKLSVRTQELKEQAQTPSNEGLIVGLDVSLLYRLEASKAANLYQTVGADYASVVVEPTLRSAIRSATANHKAETLYGEGRERIMNEIATALAPALTARGLVVERVLLRDVRLPERLKAAIESKQEAEQASMQMQFVLEKEKQEATRKAVEAEGIKQFQDIVSRGISEPLLQWKGIQATLALAQSANAKVVIIGAGKNGLPIILGEK